MREGHSRRSACAGRRRERRGGCGCRAARRPRTRATAHRPGSAARASRSAIRASGSPSRRASRSPASRSCIGFRSVRGRNRGHQEGIPGGIPSAQLDAWFSSPVGYALPRFAGSARQQPPRRSLGPRQRPRARAHRIVERAWRIRARGHTEQVARGRDHRQSGRARGLDEVVCPITDRCDGTAPTREVPMRAHPP